MKSIKLYLNINIRIANVNMAAGFTGGCPVRNHRYSSFIVIEMPEYHDFNVARVNLLIPA